MEKESKTGISIEYEKFPKQQRLGQTLIEDMSCKSRSVSMRLQDNAFQHHPLLFNDETLGDKIQPFTQMLSESCPALPFYNIFSRSACRESGVFRRVDKQRGNIFSQYTALPRCLLDFATALTGARA